MTEHSSIIGGSTAEQRIHCTGSAALEASMPEEPSSGWAFEGEALHELMYLTLDEQIEPKPGMTYTYTCPKLGTKLTLCADTLNEKFFPTLKAIMDLCEKHEIVTYEIELRRAHIKTCGEDVFGTLDFVGLSKKGYLLVVDFKFGAGIQKFARENYQLAFYTLGLWENDDPYMKGAQEFVFAIVQPWRDDVHVDEWTASMWWLENFRQLERTAYTRIKSGRTSLKAGPWCQFCRAKAICPEQQQNLEDFALRAPPQQLPGDMDVTTLAKLLKMGEQAQEAYKALVKYATELGETGVEIPGYKVIQSLGNRRYKDDSAAERVAIQSIGSAAVETKLRSPRQLEAAFKTAGEDFGVMNDHIERPLRGGRLVPDDHPAPRIQAAQDFELPDNIVPITALTKDKG